MASLRVLAFDHEGRPVQFDTWLDDLQLYLLSDSKDSVSLFDLVSGAATALPATVDSLTRSQGLTRDAAARLAIHNHLPLTECAHLRQHRTAQALYDAVVARYSSPATAALGRLLLPYLFPELSAFATVGDLVSHLCASDARYRATAPVEEHFLSLDPTSLTVHLLEQHLLAAETSAVAVGAACGTPRPPFFEGCSPSPLAPSYASAAAADVSVAEDVGAASASAKRCSSKGKGGRGGGGGSGSGGGGSGSGGGGSSGGGGGSGDGGGGGTVGRSGGSGGSGGGSGGSGGSGGGGNGSGGTGARRVGSGGGQRQQQQHRSETPSPQQLREWFLRGASRGSCPYVIRTGDHAGQTCGRLHTQHRYFSRLNDAWRAEFGDDDEIPRWADLLKSRIAIFDLDFDVILSAMYASSVSAEGDCYRCVPPDSCIAAAALGASESSTLPGISPAEALHTLDSGASCCFFCDSTTLTPLPAHVPVRLADPSGGPVVARSSTVLPCPAVPSGSLSGVGAVDPRAGGPTDTVRPRTYFVPLPQQPASPLPAPSPYTKHSGGLTERREPASRPVSPLRIARRVPRSRPPSIPGTHAMTLRPSSVPLRVPLPAPLESSLPEVPDPESDRARAASPTVSRLLATAVTDPSFESAVASALVAELLDFAAACRLDYASALVAESASASPPSVGGECALGTDVLEEMQEDFESLAAAVPRFASMLLAPEGDPDAPDIPTPRSYTEAITGPYSSQWQAAMDAEMAFWKSTGIYVKDVPPPGANIVDGMWIFRGVDYFQTFSPTPKITTLRVLLHVAAQCDYELHSLDFSTAFLQGSLHEEIWLRRPPGFTKSFPAGTRWTLRRQVYGLRQAPREWHDTLRTTLAALGFAPATADPLLFLRTDTSLPPFYVLVYVDDLVFATIDTKELTLVNTSGMGLVLGGRGPVVLTGHEDASWVDDSATQWSSQGYTFSLGSGSVSWRSTRSSSVLSSSCEAEIYAGAMAAQKLHWLTYLLTDLGEQPRSPPVLYVDNKAMIALFQEHRLEHRTKHIALRYFLARELQQRGQVRLAYVATRANTADVFTKALLLESGTENE
ncbi:unnamed protein product [Closterium sp. NIES-53]